MSTSIHILNGDALLEQFPKDLGTCIVARECMIEGNVSGTNLTEIFQNRAVFIEGVYGEVHGRYIDKVVPEFEKIANINDEADIHLWFEDDLFCQLNLWFVLYNLSELKKTNSDIYLVRPFTDLRLGFGGLSTIELSQLLTKRRRLNQEEIKTLVECWQCYQAQNFEAIYKLIEGTQLDFILPAVQALLDWNKHSDELGLPEKTLLELIETHGASDFGKIFRHFVTSLPIYGFGDTQVKRMFDKLLSNNDKQ